MKRLKLILRILISFPALILLFVLFMTYRTILIPFFWIKIDNFKNVIYRFKNYKP